MCPVHISRTLSTSREVGARWAAFLDLAFVLGLGVLRRYPMPVEQEPVVGVRHVEHRRELRREPRHALAEALAHLDEAVRRSGHGGRLGQASLKGRRLDGI